MPIKIATISKKIKIITIYILSNCNSQLFSYAQSLASIFSLYKTQLGIVDSVSSKSKLADILPSEVINKSKQLARSPPLLTIMAPQLIKMRLKSLTWFSGSKKSILSDFVYID